MPNFIHKHNFTVCVTVMAGLESQWEQWIRATDWNQ